MKYQSQQYIIKEYDECHSPDHGCQHECINTLGGYQCDCRIGYELHSDERRSERKIQNWNTSSFFCCQSNSRNSKR